MGNKRRKRRSRTWEAGWLAVMKWGMGRAAALGTGFTCIQGVLLFFLGHRITTAVATTRKWTQPWDPS